MSFLYRFLWDVTVCFLVQHCRQKGGQANAGRKITSLAECNYFVTIALRSAVASHSYHFYDLGCQDINKFIKT